MEFPPIGMRKQTGFTAGLSMTMRYFPDNNPAHVRAVCQAMFDLWRPLIERATAISMGLLIGNGEHIYRWTGNLADEFEWDHYKGHNNPQYARYGFEPIPLRPFREDWFHFTYGDLQQIIRIVRQTAKEMFGLPVTISTLCEPGPEFCESLFRYVWHPEITTYMGGGHGVSIDYKGILHGDSRPYGAYPNGIPEGEPFGRFLGKQVAHFCRVMDIDNINFSNGLGFGTHPWSIVGRNFDGERFGLARYSDLAKEILDFWVMYKREAPEQRVSAQGSNWPVGVDLAAKGVPLKDLYDRRLLDYPLGYTVSVFFDDSVGFAMAANMSRIAHAPSWDLGFYLHDPWYPQNPWEDFPYDHQAFDLYAPASIGLVDAEGALVPPCGFGTLVHDENADLQPQTARSFMPHLETAFNHVPDRIGPLTWLYPFEEYHWIMEEHPEQASAVWFGDAFTAKAIDAGLPLNNVIFTENLTAALRSGVLADTILYSPAPIQGAAYLPALMQWIQAGGRVLFYGPLDYADPAVCNLLGVRLAEPVEGDLELVWHMSLGSPAVPGAPNTLRHVATYSGGGVREVALEHTPSLVIATVSAGDAQRAYALSALEGRVLWCRGTLPFDMVEGERIQGHDLSRYVNGARIPRLLLGLLGYRIHPILRKPEQRDPQSFISRHRNAFFFSGYKPDNTVMFALRFPDGAPLFTGDDTYLRDGLAHYSLDKSYHKECRVFVDQQAEGLLHCRKTLNHEFTESEIEIRGLQDATVTLYLPLGKIEGAYIRQPSRRTDPQDNVEAAKGSLNLPTNRHGDKIVLSHLTGTLMVRW